MRGAWIKSFKRGARCVCVFSNETKEASRKKRTAQKHYSTFAFCSFISLQRANVSLSLLIAYRLMSEFKIIILPKQSCSSLKQIRVDFLR